MVMIHTTPLPRGTREDGVLASNPTVSAKIPSIRLYAVFSKVSATLLTWYSTNPSKIPSFVLLVLGIDAQHLVQVQCSFRHRKPGLKHYNIVLWGGKRPK